MITLAEIKKLATSREQQTRYLSQAIQLEEAVNPQIIRATMSVVSLAILAFLVWAGFTNINEVARTPGEVVPFGHQKTVQHFEGGIIRSIDVQEGAVVDEGQVLIVLDDASIREDLERAGSKQLSLDMQAERLRAFVEDREPDFSQFSQATEKMITDQMAFYEGMRIARAKEAQVISDQLEEKKQVVTSLNAEKSTAEGSTAIAKEMYERRMKLNKKGYASDMQVLEDEQRYNELRGKITQIENQILMAQNTITEYENRLGSIGARHRDEAYESMAQVDSESAQNIEIIHKLEERIGRMSIRAPSQGLVKGLAVNTVGAVLQPGQTVMEIVPMDKRLEVEIKISPKDIGHVQIGQDVQVKFSTYDFSRYGSVHGKLEHISATTFTGENSERYYQGRIVLEKTHVGIDPHNIVMPGMTVMADVITGQKTILQYLLKPIHTALKTSFTER